MIMENIGKIAMTMENMAIIRFAGVDTSTQPFHYLKLGADGGISGNSNVRGTVASSYKLFMAIGIIGRVTTLIIVALKIASAPASQRAEALSELKAKAIIGIVLFAIPTILGFMMRIATAFV